MTLRLKTCNRLGLNKQERDGLMLLMVVNWHLCLESNCSPSTTSVRMDASQETDTETDVETSMRDQFRNNTFQNRFLQGIEGTPQKRSEVFHPMTKPKKPESVLISSQSHFLPTHSSKGNLVHFIQNIYFDKSSDHSGSHLTQFLSSIINYFLLFDIFPILSQ